MSDSWTGDKNNLWMCTWGLSYMLCDCLFFTAFEFVFMYVRIHACVCLCVCVANSYGPSGLCICHLERQVSMCPRTPLFLVLQRPWTAFVCLFMCIALQEEANTDPVKVIMNSVCVCVWEGLWLCVCIDHWPAWFLWESQHWGKDWGVGTVCAWA